MKQNIVRYLEGICCCKSPSIGISSGMRWGTETGRELGALFMREPSGGCEKKPDGPQRGFGTDLKENQTMILNTDKKGTLAM